MMNQNPLVVLGNPEFQRGVSIARPDRIVIGPGSPLLGYRFLPEDIVIDPTWEPSMIHERTWVAHLCSKFGASHTDWVDANLWVFTTA